MRVARHDISGVSLTVCPADQCLTYKPGSLSFCFSSSRLHHLRSIFLLRQRLRTDRFCVFCRHLLFVWLSVVLSTRRVCGSTPFRIKLESSRSAEDSLAIDDHPLLHLPFLYPPSTGTFPFFLSFLSLISYIINPSSLELNSEVTAALAYSQWLPLTRTVVAAPPSSQRRCMIQSS